MFLYDSSICGMKIKCPQLTFKVLTMLLPMPATEYVSEGFRPPLSLQHISMFHVSIMVIIGVVSLPKYLYIYIYFFLRLAKHPQFIPLHNVVYFINVSLAF